MPETKFKARSKFKAKDHTSVKKHGEENQLAMLISSQIDRLFASPNNQNENGEPIKKQSDFLNEIANEAGVEFSEVEAVVFGENQCPEDNIISAISKVTGIETDELNAAKFCAAESPVPTDEDKAKNDITKHQLGSTIDSRIDEIVQSEDNQDEDGNQIRGRGDIIREIAEAAGREESTISEIISGNIKCPPDEVISGIAQVLDLSAETLSNERDCSDNKLDTQSKLFQMKHDFNWAMPLDVSPDEHMLVKGVAMSAGEAKRGEKITPENLTYGAGAMSMAAKFGMAIVNIDHHSESLPQQYIEKYGPEIADPYPPGGIIDAAVEKNKLESGKEIHQIEFIGFMTNKKVYEMIQNGEFKGTSVEELFRSQQCTCTDENNCTCEHEGSNFVNLALILEEVPNSDGTWVAPVTKEDIDKWRANAEKRDNEVQLSIMKAKNGTKVSHKMKAKEAVTYGLITTHATRPELTRNDLEDYLDENGKFKDGKNGIIEYLMEEKEIPETTARDIADYLFKNPDALNQQQFKFMSGDDLVAWFRHIQNENIYSELHSIKNILLGKEQPQKTNHSTKQNKWPYKFKKKSEVHSAGLIENHPAVESPQKTEQTVTPGSYLARKYALKEEDNSKIRYGKINTKFKMHSTELLKQN